MRINSVAALTVSSSGCWGEKKLLVNTSACVDTDHALSGR